MTKCIVTGLVVAAVATQPLSQAQRPQLPAAASCRHTEAERPDDRVRREEALTLARQINATEGTIADKTRRYAPLVELRNLPQTPTGFDLRLYSDGTSYAFSLKDKLDVCHYAIFSDQDGLLYEKTPQAVQMASTRRP